MNSPLPILGIIGLGEMGSPISRRAVCRVQNAGFDLNPDRLATCTEHG
jgi:3-hydroxyisobutyrate dehydrogenase-like beta-hydroxyacid dehydrogenase